MNYHLAQINIGRMQGVDINDPLMQEFVDNLDRINALAESAPGFVWRLKDDTNSATHLNPYGDVQIIVNMSVWESMGSLEHFVFKTMHTEFLRRRKQWFQRLGKPHQAMWWIPEGQVPTIKNGVDRLAHLQTNGPSEHAFDFKMRFSPPGDAN